MALYHVHSVISWQSGGKFQIITADLKYTTELEGKNGCVVTSIHEPTLAKDLFVKCKEGGYIGYSFIEKIAAVYAKLKEKKIVI